jgi:hypothetical protein
VKKARSVYDELPDVRSVFPKTLDKFRDLDRAIDELVIDPRSTRFFRKNNRFFTQGSCFAEHIHSALISMGYESHWEKWVEDINSPLALAAMFNKRATHDSQFCSLVGRSDVAVITVGVAPCWFKKSDDTFVINNALNLREIDGYYQRTLTVEECKKYLAIALSRLSHLNENIKIVLTLSPVPLARTFEFNSAIVADAVSKSVLRAAIHELIGMYPDKFFYFPSYEMVTWLGRYRGDAFGAEGVGPRHVSAFYLDAILRSFIRNYQISE